MTLPAAAAKLRGRLAYELAVEGLGTWRVAAADGRVELTPRRDGSTASRPAGDGAGARAPAGDGADFRLETDARGLAELAAGASPLRLLLSRRLRIRGRRRRALRLRALGGGELVPGPIASVEDARAAGVPV